MGLCFLCGDGLWRDYLCDGLCDEQIVAATVGFMLTAEGWSQKIESEVPPLA